MILSETLKTNVETNAELETTNFRIDPSYMNKMIWLTINQYEFKIRTPVQEIISNARDAHREVGNIAPIKIILPTLLDPTFKVRDYGTGLTPKAMRDVFTSFGATTKSDSNNQTGGFGIGAKSPLTYTDQYNVSTYVDGKVWHYAVIRGADSGIELKLLMTGVTTEENGTDIQIPVKNGDHQTFIQAASRCTMFWDVQPIFNLPETLLFKAKDVINLGDNLELYRRGDLGDIFHKNIIAVIDGIPYEIDTYKFNIGRITGNRGTLVLLFNTGEIDILQTRESLVQNDKNIGAIKSAIEEYNTSIEEFKEKVLDKSNLTTFLTSYKAYSDVLGLGNEKFKDYRVSSSSVSLTSIRVERYNYKGNYGKIVKNMKKDQLSWFDMDDNSLILFDDVRNNESSVMKRRRIKNALLDYSDVFVVKMETNNIKKGRAKALKNFYFDFKGFYTKLSEIEHIKIEKKIRTSGGIKRAVIEFCVTELNRYGQNSQWYKTDNFPTDTKFVYVKKDGNATPHINTHIKNYINELKGIKLIAVSNKSYKLIKDKANVQTLEAFISEIKPTRREILDNFHYENCHNKSYRFLLKNRNKLLNRNLRNLVYKLGKLDTRKRGTNFPSAIIKNSEEYKSLVFNLKYLKRAFKSDISFLENGRYLHDNYKLSFLNRRK